MFDESKDELLAEVGVELNGEVHHIIIKLTSPNPGKVYAVMYHKKKGKFTSEELENYSCRLIRLNLLTINNELMVEKKIF